MCFNWNFNITKISIVTWVHQSWDAPNSCLTSCNTCHPSHSRNFDLISKYIWCYILSHQSDHNEISLWSDQSFDGYFHGNWDLITTLLMGYLAGCPHINSDCQTGTQGINTHSKTQYYWGPAGAKKWQPGGRLNIKILSYQYRHSHVKDKTVFNMEIPIPGKDGLYIETGPRAPSQYKVHLSQVWGFPC